MPFFSDYARLRFLLRVIDPQWGRFLDQQLGDTPGFEAAKERVLQEHARAFFSAVITIHFVPEALALTKCLPRRPTPRRGVTT